MIRRYHFSKYAEPMGFDGKDFIGLSGAPRKKLAALIPSLVDPTGMKKRWGLASSIRAYNGELPDEVHEFSRATQGDYRLRRILLREGSVIEVTLHFEKQLTKSLQ